MPVKTRPWDAAEFLTDDQDIRHYLEAAFEDGDPALIREARSEERRVGKECA